MSDDGLYGFIGYSTPRPTDPPSGEEVADKRRPWAHEAEGASRAEVEDLLPMRPGCYLAPADRMRWIRFLKPYVDPLTPTYVDRWVLRTWLGHGLLGLPYAEADTLISLIRDDPDTIPRRRAAVRRSVAYEDWRCRKYAKHRIHGKFRRIAIARANGRCHYCNCPVRRGDFEIDHVIPVSRGGRSRLSNLVAACYTCNRSKRDMLLSEWEPMLALRREVVKTLLEDEEWVASFADPDAATIMAARKLDDWRDFFHVVMDDGKTACGTGHHRMPGKRYRAIDIGEPVRCHAPGCKQAWPEPLPGELPIPPVTEADLLEAISDAELAYAGLSADWDAKRISRAAWAQARDDLARCLRNARWALRNLRSGEPAPPTASPVPEYART